MSSKSETTIFLEGQQWLRLSIADYKEDPRNECEWVLGIDSTDETVSLEVTPQHLRTIAATLVAFANLIEVK